MMTVHNFLLKSSESFSDFLNKDLEEKLIKKYATTFPVFAEGEVTETIIEKSLSHPGALSSKGLFSFYAAQYLYQINQEKNSLLMMTEAWKRTDLSKYPPSVQEKFIEVSKYLLSKTKRSPFKEARQKLIYSLKESVHSYIIPKQDSRETASNIEIEVIL